MFRKLATGFTALLCAAFLTVSAFAHPGNTDSSGGHYNRSTGEYHYHHGYPAHQHTNGKCPYDYDDKTGQNSIPSQDNDSIGANASPRTFGSVVKSILNVILSGIAFLCMACFWVVLIKAFLPSKPQRPSSPVTPQPISPPPASKPSPPDPAPLPEPVSPPQPRPQKASIPLHGTDSSAISHWGYDPYTRRLLIRMRDSGILYVYYDVPYEVALDLRYAPSVGQYYNSSIKGKYRSRNHGYRELPNDPPLS